MNMQLDQALAIANHASRGHYGSFASALGCAYILADQWNREKLLAAFSDLFQRIADDLAAHEQFLAAK